MDRQKYQAELKAKQSVDEMRSVQKTSMRDAKGILSVQSSFEQKLLKTELELKKAEKQIEKLQE